MYTCIKTLPYKCIKYRVYLHNRTFYVYIYIHEKVFMYAYKKRFIYKYVKNDLCIRT